MTANNQPFIITPKDTDTDLYERIRDAIREANTRGFQSSTAIAEIGLNNIVHAVVSQDSAAFLLKNGGIVRVGIEHKTVECEDRSGSQGPGQAITSPSSTQSSGNSSSAAAARTNSAAKFRRVMLSTSTIRRGERGGVIIDSRARPLPSEQAVPEHLIAQAQVVLQGKSRDVIVRELRRTHLNVNEAVNNLLSRDDDEDEGDEGNGEVVLPEELLSLLDPLHGSIAEEQIYGSSDNFDYIMAREIRSRGKDNKDRDGKKRDENDMKTRLELGHKLEYWSERATGVPQGVQRFVKMAATCSEILAVSSDGKLYGWRWGEALGDTKPHQVATQLLQKSESIVHLATCSLRVAITTNENRIITWFDENKCGERIRAATQCVSTPLEVKIDELCVSNLLAVARAESAFFWCGVYPFSERQKIWEKERNKSRKHVTFESNAEIVEGSEIRSKSCPLYAAGSVALCLSNSQPVVGVLMESAWTHSEMCRFRVIDPLAFDSDLPVAAADFDGDKKAVFAHPGSRKRRAIQEVFGSPSSGGNASSQKEEAWQIGECIWVYEQQPQDTAIAKIVDGAFIAVEYQRLPGDMTYASSLSATLNKDTPANNRKMRLLRKDDMCLVSSKSASPRTPTVLQKEPGKFQASSSVRKVLSVVADSTGIRALVEKRNGRLHIARISVKGHVLSDRPLPLHPSALYGPALEPPKLVNYGDDRILMLVDGNNCVTLLMRNALMGFREPVVLHQPTNRFVSLFTNNPISVKTPNLLSAMILLLPGPSQRAVERGFPSLLQTVLHADAATVKRLLDDMIKTGDEDLWKQEIRDSRTDCGGNILHAAIRIAVANKNRDDADPGSRRNPSRDEPSRSTGSGSSFMDPLETKWQRLMRSRRDDPGTQGLAGGNAPGSGTSPLVRNPTMPVEVDISAQEIDPRADLTGAAAAAAAAMSSGPITRSRAHEQLSVAGNFANFAFAAVQQLQQHKDEYSNPVSDSKDRQKGAIDIPDVLVSHDVLKAYLPNLLAHRDADGYTPFTAAANIRAYGAALHLWKAIATVTNNFNTDSMPYVHPQGGRVDDSLLFLLCYNDNCSFTWTGDSHINQDIYECRDCALVNSLCCCTECAQTCHRNHDCRLKRTSPTAYCDCWEKCPCKAVIAGNQEKREELLKMVLLRTNLHEQTNKRGEHILLFLARTVGRQTSEQGNYSKKRPRYVSDNSNMPEHDLDPPKFANFALESCISMWKVVKNLLTIGYRSLSLSEPIAEDLFHLNCQSGSTHLDKFVFTLLAKCPEKYTNILVDTIVNVLNDKCDPECVTVASRLVRSVIRLYVISVLVSPIAAAAAIAGEAPAGNATPNERRGVHATISLSGFLSLIKRNANPNKETKSTAIANFVLRCRHVLRRLCSISCLEVAAAADAILAPVRLGMVKANWPIMMTAGQDALEVIERYLTYEPDMTTVLSMSEENRERRKRKSRRDTDRADRDRRHPIGGGTGADSSDGDSDSDGDDPDSARRHNSQSGNETVDSLGNVAHSAVRRKSGISGLAVTNRDRIRSGDSDDEEDRSLSSTDDEEDEDQSRAVIDEDMEDDEDNEEDMDDDPLYDNSDGDGEAEHNVSMFEIANGNYDGSNSREGEDYIHSSPHYDDGEDSNGGEGSNTFRDETVEDAEIRNINERREENPAAEPTSDSGNAREEQPPAPTSQNANEQPSQQDAENQNQSADNSNDSSRRRQSRDRRSSESTLSWTLRRNTAEDSRRNETWRDSLLAGSHDTAGQGTTNASNVTSIGDSSSAGNSQGNRGRNEDGEESSNRTVQIIANAVESASGTGLFGKKKHTDVATGKSTHETTYQLSAGFSFLVRCLSDLLNFLQAEDEDIDQPFKVYDAQKAAAILSGAAERLSASFSWMSTAMDRIEAQLRFGNAIMASGVAESRFKAEKRAVKRKDRKDKMTEDLYQKKKETLEYMMGILRSYSAEAGDDLPVIELENLRTLAFAFDAYLVFSNASDALREVAASTPHTSSAARTRSSESNQSPDHRTVHTFFRRSDSVSFPGTAACDAWDLIEGSGAHVPLVEHPDLLTADADRNVLFAAPQEQVSTTRYREIYKNLGVSDVGHQGFTTQMDTSRMLREIDDEDQMEVKQEEGIEVDKRKEEYPVPEGMEPLSLENVREEMKKSTNTKQHKVMSRWKNTLLLMAKECHEAILDSLGGETGNSPLLTTIATFAVRQAQFKKIMDKFRNSQMKDINLEVNRESVQLVRDTVFQLNQTFVRRSNQPKGKDNDATSPLLASARVKVRFRDEPGEGTGVARSFYTALAEALQQLKKLPFEELGWTGGEDYLYGGLNANGFSQQSPAQQQGGGASSGPLERTSSRGRIQIMRERSGAFGGRKKFKRHPLQVTSQPYTPRSVDEALRVDGANAAKQERCGDEPARERPVLSDAIYAKVHAIRPSAAPRIAGILVDLPVTIVLQMLSGADTFR
ncbi:hypothetical protein WR25_22291 isoform B [Diploscapter pachys]|nr:hypothetical protein WR25_22291 isoform B [Diploscapter pachys]